MGNVKDKKVVKDIKESSEKDEKDQEEIPVEVKNYKKYIFLYDKLIIQCNAIKRYVDTSMQKNLHELFASIKKMETFFEKDFKTIKDMESKEYNIVQINEKHKMLLNRHREMAETLTFIPNSMIVTLVSHFDNFFASVLKNIIMNVEGLIKNINNKLSYHELHNFTSMKEAKEFYVDTFISDLMRESHNEHFKFLKEKLKLDLNINESDFKNFLLLTQIRHIIVHNNAIVNRSFLHSLKKYGIKNDDEYVEGKEIPAGKDFDSSIKCILKIATVLFAAIGKKYYFNESEGKDSKSIDDTINEHLIIDLLKLEEYDLTINLLNYLINNSKHDSSYNFTYNINLAIAYKGKKDQKKVVEIINKLDFTSCDNRYKFAKFVLLDEYEKAATFMKLYNSGEWKFYYCKWPLFKWFIETDIFKNTYQAIFGEDFVKQQINIDMSQKEIDKIMKQINKEIKKAKKEDSKKTINMAG